MDEQQKLEQEGQEAAQQVMPPKKKPNRAPLVIFSVVVLLSLVGYGVYAWQNNRVAELETQVADLKKPNSDTPAASTTTTSDPYKGWNTFASTYQDTSFKYPANWKLEKTALDVSMWPGAYSAKLTGPNGLVVTYIDVVDGIGGGCEDTAPRVVLSDIESVDGSNGATPIYIVTDNLGASGLIDYKQSGGVPKVGKTEFCMYYTIINGKKHNNQLAFAFGSGYMVGTSSSKPSTAQSKDSQEGQLILKSFKFTN